MQLIWEGENMRRVLDPKMSPGPRGPVFASGPRPHGWFYDERRTPAINDCLTAAAGKQKRQ